MRPTLRSLAVACIASALAFAAPAAPQSAPPADKWQGDLSPISAKDWNAERAAHLLSRAGFGGTPEDIAKLAAMSPSEAVKSLVYFKADGSLKPFDHSGIHD